MVDPLLDSYDSLYPKNGILLIINLRAHLGQDSATDYIPREKVNEIFEGTNKDIQQLQILFKYVLRYDVKILAPENADCTLKLLKNVGEEDYLSYNNVTIAILTHNALKVVIESNNQEEPVYSAEALLYFTKNLTLKGKPMFFFYQILQLPPKTPKLLSHEKIYSNNIDQFDEPVFSSFCDSINFFTYITGYDNKNENYCSILDTFCSLVLKHYRKYDVQGILNSIRTELQSKQQYSIPGNLNTLTKKFFLVPKDFPGYCQIIAYRESEKKLENDVGLLQNAMNQLKCATNVMFADHEDSIQKLLEGNCFAETENIVKVERMFHRYKHIIFALITANQLDLTNPEVTKKIFGYFMTGCEKLKKIPKLCIIQDGGNTELPTSSNIEFKVPNSILCYGRKIYDEKHNNSMFIPHLCSQLLSNPGKRVLTTLLEFSFNQQNRGYSSPLVHFTETFADFSFI